MSRGGALSLMAIGTSASLALAAGPQTVLVAVPKQVENAFRQYMKEHERTYDHDSAEYAERLAVFKGRLDEIEAQNAQPQRLWTAGVNHITDRTDEERLMLCGYKPAHRDGDGEMPAPAATELAHSQTTEMQEFDWKNLTIATTIPDQGSCGSCWAVTTASVLDAHHEIYISPGRRFSAQELVSCVKNSQNCGGKGGCDGATVELGMEYALKSGLTTLTQTPYKGKDLPCGESQMPVLASGVDDGHGHGSGGHAFGLVSWEMLVRNKEAPLVKALMEKGPVAISVAAAQWFSYKNGIFNSCSSRLVDHAVTLYGYGKEGSQRYWLIRNSWGEKWGETGFIRMFRAENAEKEEGDCGWDMKPQMGTGCDGGPDKVLVCGTCGILYDNVVPTFNKSVTSSLFVGRQVDSKNDNKTDDGSDGLLQDGGARQPQPEMRAVQRHADTPLVRREV